MSFFPKHPSSRVGITQTIAFDASAAITNAFGSETYQLRLASDSACCYRIGDGVQTATIADVFPKRSAWQQGADTFAIEARRSVVPSA
jgi:hypothetical protein